MALLALSTLTTTVVANTFTDLNHAPSSLPSNTTTTTTPSSPCACGENITDTFYEHAIVMKMAMRNRTSLLSKIRHRTTHSDDAVWASLCLSFLVTVLVVGILQSRLWSHRPHVSSMDSQPIKFIQWNPLNTIKVRRLLRSRGRSLLGRFGGRQDRAGTQALRMSEFLGPRDTVDGVYKQLVQSSSSSSSESEFEEVVYGFNTSTGLWEGEEEEEGVSLLGRRGKRRSRRRGRSRRSSSESSSSLLGAMDTSVSRDLVRLSSGEEEEEELMVKVG